MIELESMLTYSCLSLLFFFETLTLMIPNEELIIVHLLALLQIFSFNSRLNKKIYHTRRIQPSIIDTNTIKQTITLEIKNNKISRLGQGGPEFQKYHPKFQLGTFICIWDIRKRLRPPPTNKNEYPPTARQFNYTKEI